MVIRAQAKPKQTVAKRKVIDASTAKREPKWVRKLRQVLSWGAVSHQALADAPLPLTKNRLVRFIARELRETDRIAIARIAGVVTRVGTVPACNVMIRTMQIQAAGGLERDDGKGRRTAGGTFFYLTRSLWAGKQWGASRSTHRKAMH